MGSVRPAPFSTRPQAGQAGEPATGVVGLSRSTLIGAGIVAVLLVAWAGAATWCLVNGDTLTARLLAKQSAMQYAYEEKIAALRTQLERVTSQRLVEQN